MVMFDKLALSIWVVTASVATTTCSAFTSPTATTRRTVSSSKINMVAAPMDLKEIMSSPPPSEDPEKSEEPSGPKIDLTGIAFSGLQGKAFNLAAEDFPKAAEVRRVIPDECFKLDTKKSLGYLSVSTVATALCTAAGISLAGVIGTSSILTLPIWAAYSVITGTVAMGLWVLAHECGHGAFSNNKKLQDAVGYVLHSLMLVPYYSWQRSHAVHHQYTNHMELGETHVPEALTNEDEGSYALRKQFLNTLGEKNGMITWGIYQSFMHLIIGWPAYLLIGATGGPDRGMTNHYYPNPLTDPKQPKRELFPGNWKEKVYQSDIGIAAVIGGLLAWTACNGFGQVMALYGGPLIVINAWLVLYTWLQHTDVDVPHFEGKDHSYVRGALHTIDRPYDKLDPWGIIDFLHHKIGSTHVAHHFDSSIPHYNAQKATDAIKEKFPQFYLYDPTPIPQALWRVAKGCSSVEKRGDMYVWKNDGIKL